jgi:hypothetical protein
VVGCLEPRGPPPDRCVQRAESARHLGRFLILRCPDREGVCLLASCHHRTMHEGEVVRLLIAYGEAAHVAHGRPLTPAVMRREVFTRLPRPVGYGLAVEDASGHLRVRYRGRTLASFETDGSLAWTRCAIPPGTPPIDSPEFRKGHEQFRAAVATLASAWTSTGQTTCGGRPRAREASPRSRGRRSRRVSRAGPSGDDGSGLSDSDGPARRADARRSILAEVRR